MVLRHERDHEKNTNQCMQSTTARDLLAKLESLAGDKARVLDQRDRAWTEFEKKLGSARQGGLAGLTSPVFWEHRFQSRWGKHALQTQGHGGTWGC